jgi:hypothetical protein
MEFNFSEFDKKYFPFKLDKEITSDNFDNKKIIIEDIDNNNIKLFSIKYDIKSLNFYSISLIQFIDIEKLNETFENFDRKIEKIKLKGYLTNGKKNKLFFPNLNVLIIKNSIYPNFDIFQQFNFQNNQLQTFKLENFKFSSNDQIKEFFYFIKEKKIRNLYLKDIFIEILEENDISEECGILKTYFDFNGYQFFFYINEQIILCENIQSLFLENCRLVNINLDNFTTIDKSIKVIFNKNSILNIEDSLLKYSSNEKGISLALNGDYNINNKIFEIINNYKLNSLKFVNFDYSENLNLSFKNITCNNLKFKQCHNYFIKEILSNIKSPINSLSIKDSFGDYDSFIIIDNINLFSGNNISLKIIDSNFDIPKINYHYLKLCFYSLEKEELNNNINLFSTIYQKHNNLILEGNIFSIFSEIKNFEAENIIFDNLIIDENIEKSLQNSNICEKEITYLNMFKFFPSNKKINLDYTTFNNIVYVNNEINDFEHLISLLLYEEDKKLEEIIKKVNNSIQIFYSQKQTFCFLIKNNVEFRNIILSLTCFYNQKTLSQNNILEQHLKNNFIKNECEQENFKILSIFYFSEEQRKIIENLKNISFKKNVYKK